MKKLALKIENENIKNAILKYFNSKEIEICEDTDNYDLLACCTDDETPNDKTLNLHFSLLPAFKGKNALTEAFLAGVKVSGITIYRTLDDKIIAQYPVLIGLGTHFDEYSNELEKIASKIYPIVIECILQDKVFDFSELFSQEKSSCCSGNCSNCKGKH